jgi:Leucine-rich repeat (LRR) protein
MKNSKKGCYYFVLLFSFVVFSSCYETKEQQLEKEKQKLLNLTETYDAIESNVTLDLKLRIPEDRNTDILLQFPQGTLTEKDKNALAALIKWGDRGYSLNYPEKLKLIAIQYQNNVTDKDIEFLRTFSNLEDLYLVYCPQITDKGMDILAYLPHLKILSLGGTNVTEASISCVAKLKNLGELYIEGLKKIDLSKGVPWQEQSPPLSNETLRLLKDSNLKRLWLITPTLIDDEGLKYLVSMKKLEEVYISTMNVTSKGIDFLRNIIKESDNKLRLIEIFLRDYSKPYNMDSRKLEIIRENGKQITWSYEIESVP